MEYQSLRVLRRYTRAIRVRLPDVLSENIIEGQAKNLGLFGCSVTGIARVVYTCKQLEAVRLC